MSGGRRMVCSRRKVRVSRGMWDVNEDALREGNLLEPLRRAFCLASLSVRPYLKWRAATSNSKL